MRSFREMKRHARRQLHEHMSEQVLYLLDSKSDPVSCTVRLHLKFDELGELLRGGFAERQEITPRIVFMAEQVRPVRGGIVVTQDMGAWRVDNDLPPDDITITAEVIRLTKSQITGFGWNPDADYLGIPAPETI